jgi:hypothetical protein
MTNLFKFLILPSLREAFSNAQGTLQYGCWGGVLWPRLEFLCSNEIAVLLSSSLVSLATVN